MSVTLLREKILPAAFGPAFVECELDGESAAQDQFQSNVVFVTAVLKNNEKETTRLPLVVKFEPFNVDLRTYLMTPLQFYIEVLMYSKVLPFLNRNAIAEEIFAKFYYGVGTIKDPDSDVVVIQDLRPLGFRLTKEKAFIDYEHLAISMSKLGRFHALSYAAKTESNDEFYNFVRSLKETCWSEENTWHPLIIACFHRAIDPLIQEGKHVEILQRLMSCVETDVLKFMKGVVAPEEPRAVICHGDFCRNNLLFKYDNGKPIDVKFFDIATARYSTPAVDIAFFLFLNSSKEVRKAHWDDLLKIYHNGLSTAIPGLEVPSLEDVKEELRKKAVYGFVHCSFFLPMMLYEKPFNNLEDVMNGSFDLSGTLQVQLGGEEGTKLLSEMVEELVDRGCLTLDHKILE